MTALPTTIKNRYTSLPEGKESWFTYLEKTPLNRSQQLPAPYKPLIDEIKQN